MKTPPELDRITDAVLASQSKTVANAIDMFEQLRELQQIRGT